MPIRVIVVDDSPSQLALLVGLLKSSPDFEVVGTAANGRAAVTAVEELRPQVVAMDIHLPFLDGYEATRLIMQRCPTPIVLFSSSGGDAALRSVQALAAGALTVVSRPSALHLAGAQTEREQFLRTLRLMSGVKVVTRHAPRGPQHLPPPPAPLAHLPNTIPGRGVIAIAASTGGPTALQTVLSGLGAAIPWPILVVQHISDGFTDALATWLAGVIPQPIELVRGELPLKPGVVYLAADLSHLGLAGLGVAAKRAVRPEDRYCPSADWLFASVAQVYGHRALGVIMTGMGDDGARGLLALRQAGGLTLGQDEASSVVYGMPRAAYELGAVQRVVPLSGLAGAILVGLRDPRFVQQIEEGGHARTAP